jgi:nucleoside-diphosphate-sugar epimerase
MTIAILGANGVYGRHLTPRLSAAGFRVPAIVRRPQAAGPVRACGAEIHVADVFDAEPLHAALGGCAVCINLATSLPGDGRGFVSLVHIADMAAATVAALEAWPSRQTLIIADDLPARWCDVFEYIAAIAGAGPPKHGGRNGFPSFRMSNRRAREALGWAPRYADYRAGLMR